jgi:hypothetical protein
MNKKITISEIKLGLINLGYNNKSVDSVIIPWLKEELCVIFNGIKLDMKRWELFETYSKTIQTSIVASNAIENEKVVCDEFGSLIFYLDKEIRIRFNVVSE